MKQIKFALCILPLFLISCSSMHENIVKFEDIRYYIVGDYSKNSKILAWCNNDIDFWSNRLRQHPDNSGFKQTVASLLAQRFKLKGNIDDLIYSDSLFISASSDFLDRDVSLLQSLAQNSIMKHQFKLAVKYVRSAYNLNEDKETSAGILFDALMEVGQYEEAEKILETIRDMESVNYLIREAKLYEQKGKFDESVEVCGKIFLLAEKSNNVFLKCWTKNMLGRLYIESGKIKEAYSSYLDALKADPCFTPALEGIASIAFSFDGNTDIPQKIYEYLNRSIESPDAYLNFSKIANYNKDYQKKNEYLNLYLSKISNLKYGRMYNKYLVMIETEELKDYKKAVEISENEINERPSPSAYFLLAWSYYKSGNLDAAEKVIKEHVENKTSDPEIISKLDEIYLQKNSAF